MGKSIKTTFLSFFILPFLLHLASCSSHAVPIKGLDISEIGVGFNFNNKTIKFDTSINLNNFCVGKVFGIHFQNNFDLITSNSSDHTLCLWKNNTESVECPFYGSSEASWFTDSYHFDDNDWIVTNIYDDNYLWKNFCFIE